MTESRPMVTLLDQFASRNVLEYVSFNFTTHREAIGSIVYLMVCIGPDLVFTVGELLQFVESTTLLFCKFIKRGFSICQKCCHLGITSGCEKRKGLSSFCYREAD